MTGDTYVNHDQAVIDQSLAHFGEAPSLSVVDQAVGRWRRFGKKKNYAIKLHDSDEGGYVYLLKDHVSGELVKGCTDQNNQKRLSPAELKALKEKRLAREARELERAMRRKSLLQRYIVKIWHKGIAPKHYENCFKYLSGKGFSRGKNVRFFVSTSKRRNHRVLMLLPMVCPIDQEIYSLYLIYQCGFKRPVKGTQMSGLCMFIADQSLRDSPVIWITEGYATGLSLYQDVKQPVAVAFSAVNLLPVVEKLVQVYPGARLKLCADNDIDKERERGFNTGINAANKIKEQFPQVEILVPQFPEGTTGLSDYNDLQQYLRKQAPRKEGSV